MKKVIATIASAVLAVALTSFTVAAQGSEAQAEVLATALDPAKETVLVGRARTENMIIQLELEPAQPMWMAMTASVQLKMDNSKGTWTLYTTPPAWSEHPVEKGTLYHVEVKPIDPRSETRIPYATVKFKARNEDNGRTVEGDLHPMWGGSGLHYALNSGLAGDGTYVATVTVEPPTFARSLKDKMRWMEPEKATFHFRLADGKLTEVSRPDTD